MTAPPPSTVLILGAGLTGLTAAYLLLEQGHRVTLLDAPGWQDGYGADAGDTAPIVLGCHLDIRRLLRAIDDGETSRSDSTVRLEFPLPDGRTASYRPPPLPGALHWIIGLLGFHGLAWHDRWRLFSHLEQIWEQTRTLPPDLDNRIADEWLASIGQNPEAREQIWNPLSRWLTGNDLARLSGAVFVRQLSALFLRKEEDARLTYVHGSVGSRLMAPLRRALDRHGIQILLQSDTPDLRLGPDGVEGIRLRNGDWLRAQRYITALPHRKLLALLPEHLLTRYAYFAQIGELEVLGDVAVSFTRPSAHPSPRLLLLGGRPFHQLLIAPSGPNEVTCRLSAVGNPALTELRDDDVIELGRMELRRLCPDLSPDDERTGGLARHDHAALSLKPGASLCRPIQQSPLPNLLLAGAWTDTGWPATVESSIASARRCAEIISTRLT